MDNSRSKITDNNRVLQWDKGIFTSQDFCFDYFPTPFIWNPEAPIWILLANPWLDTNPKTIKQDIMAEDDPYCKRAILTNLRLDWAKNDYPLVYVDPKFSQTGGYKYRNNGVFDFLIKKEGISPSSIAKNVFILEMYWYHSREFKFNQNIRGSEGVKYAKYLLEERAIKNNKIILCTRAVSTWFELVPSLEMYDNCHFSWHRRRLEIKNTTICPEIYQKFLEILHK